jgi:two-component system sensor histidine kinase SenX3
VSSLGYVAAFLGGGVLGWLLYYLVDLRGVPQSLPPAPAAPPERLEVEVLRWSTTGYLVMDGTGRPLLHNDRASELGLINGGIVNRDIVAAAGRCTVSGESGDVELRPVSSTASLTARSRPLAVHAVVRSIGNDRILVSATDETASQRMEAARRDFVANVSHELKTPVAAMGLLAEATVDAADDPEEARRFAGKLQAEAVRMAALVNELIALSRLQGADPLPDLAVVEIDAVVRETVSRIASAAERARITVICDQPSGLLVRGDRALLVTALTNLVDNAINYSTAGTQVSISRGLTDGWVQVSVTDRGIGIAPEYTERVFERFFRIDPARSRSTGGTGLGLAIVKHVAANHGGSATVWSRPGTGSTFTLRLPAVPQQLPPEHARSQPPAELPSVGEVPAERPLTEPPSVGPSGPAADTSTPAPAHRGAP